MKNPWLGLSSYTESSIKDYQFNGRSEAINALAELIRQNLFVTLYGRSGIGKTSLLQAGVFPVLRKYGMCPVSIRLNEIKDGETNACEVVWSKICDVLGKQGCQFKEDTVDPYTPDFVDVLVIRKLFSSGRFINEKGVAITPVIVLDQFEEFLYTSQKASRLFVSQLYALIDDNVNLKVPHPTWHDDTDFRIVVSIREDDLFLFEDLIDRLNCEDLKSNRYRLMPLSDKDAKEIILKPSKDKCFFEEWQEEEIAEEIIKLCKTNGDSINTLMLSLTCYVLYNNYVGKNQRISLNSLNGYKDILESYYLESVKNLPKSQRFFLEDNLVDSQGRRKSIYLSDLNKRAPKAKDLIGDSNNRLLTVNQGRVELIHDQLATSVSKIKTNRRSRKTKQVGVFALIVGLVILFVFSFSCPYPNIHNFGKKLAAIETSKNYVSLENCGDVIEYIIEEGDEYNVPYGISSCSNLRTIKIEKQTAYVRIFNCPRLTKIEINDNFNGQIDVYNCPNLFVENHINIIRDWTDFKNYTFKRSEDSISFYEFNSEYGLLGGCLYSIYYDSLSNKFTCPDYNYKNDSIKVNGKYFVGILGCRTGLPDSLKIQTDLYVPSGRIEEYKLLNEFMPFRSINEAPFYSLWSQRFKAMLHYFDGKPLMRKLSIIGLILLQIIFWIIGYNNYKTKSNNFYLNLFRAFAYGIGMSMIGLISFMAFYWLVFIILLPYNQIVSIISGFIGCLICLFIIYKNAFYPLYLYFKENGVRFVIRDICKGVIWFYKIIVQYIRVHKKLILICLGVIICLLICCGLYVSGKNKRLVYLSQLPLIENNVKLSKIVDMLESQHGNVFYRFFTGSLNAYKEILSEDSLKLVCTITPKYLSKLAWENNIDINIERFLWSNDYIDMVSADGIKQCIEVRDGKNGRKYLLYYDMYSEYVDTIISYDYSVNHTNCSFSPSADNILVSIDNNIYSYSTKYHKTTRFPHGPVLDVIDILMYDENTFFVISGRTLYKGNIDNEQELLELCNEYTEWNDNLILIEDNKLAANSSSLEEACIYDLDNYTLSSLSANEQIGSLISATSDKLVTNKGFFNLKNGYFLPFEDPYASKFVIGENILSIARSTEGDKYVIKDAESGKIVDNIYRSNDDVYSTFWITKDGNLLLTHTSYAIFVYSLYSENTADWPITEREKRIFDLK